MDLMGLRKCVCVCVRARGEEIGWSENMGKNRME